MHRFLIPVALAALAQPTLAQQRVTKDPPPKRSSSKPAPKPPTRAAAAPSPAANAVATAKALADADVAFAQRAGSGIKDALLATLADDAVLFHPRAVSGRGWAGAATFPAGRFTWAPAWSAVSADGTLGVTSGPIAFTSPTPDSSMTGEYVHVWTRSGGTWRLLLELLVPGPQPSQVTFAPHQPAGDGRPRSGPGAVEASKATLYIADRGLAAAARANGSSAAFSRVALPDAHLLRPGILPAIGPDSVRSTLAAREADAHAAWQMADLRMAQSADFGVSYGAYEMRNAAGGIAEEGNYVRVWERQPDGGWRILLDATAPLTMR